MNEARKRQLETAISDLEATVRSERGQIANNRAMLESAERGSQHARDLEKKIKNLENDIKHNEQRISELKRELRS